MDVLSTTEKDVQTQVSARSRMPYRRRRTVGGRVMMTSVSCSMKCALLALACVFAGSVFAQDMVKVDRKSVV